MISSPTTHAPSARFVTLFALILAAGLALSGVVRAAPPQNPEQVNGMIKQIEAFHEEGLALRERYDLADEDQLKTCQDKQQEKAEQARALRGQAAKLPDLAYRVNLTMAANDALACVSCDTEEDACQGVPAALDRVQKQMESSESSESNAVKASK